MPQDIVTGGIGDTTPFGVVLADGLYWILCWAVLLAAPVAVAAYLAIRNKYYIKGSDHEEGDS